MLSPVIPHFLWEFIWEKSFGSSGFWLFACCRFWRCGEMRWIGLSAQSSSLLSLLIWCDGFIWFWFSGGGVEELTSSQWLSMHVLGSLHTSQGWFLLSEVIIKRSVAGESINSCWTPWKNHNQLSCTLLHGKIMQYKKAVYVLLPFSCSPLISMSFVRCFPIKQHQRRSILYFWCFTEY